MATAHDVNCLRDRRHIRASIGEHMGMFNKVLILSASAGAGHVRAAQALERAFAETGLAQDVQHIDALQYTTKAFHTLYSKVYFDMVTSVPDLVGWLYDQTDKPWH